MAARRRGAGNRDAFVLKLVIAAVGRIKPGPEAALIDDYRARFDGVGRALGFGPLSIEEVDARGKSRDDESAALLKRIDDGDCVVALDERGTTLASETLSRLICDWRDDGVRCTRFLIGGADGHSRELRQRAHKLLSFGKATWPHMLVRAMLAEQLYRAAAIAANHPYHRGG